MATVGAYEAKTHLSGLLERVKRGERITITKHGVPVAVLVPVASAPQEAVRDVVDALRSQRKRYPLGDLDLREAIEKGRR